MDLSTFKPASAKELLEGMWEQVRAVLTGDFAEVKQDVSVQMEALADKVWRTQALLAAGAISPEDADLALHTQELLLNNILLYSRFMTYKAAQDVLDAVFETISAAIANLTGVELNF